MNAMKNFSGMYIEIRDMEKDKEEKKQINQTNQTNQTNQKKEEQPLLQGAGVLPMFKNPFDGQWYIILGRERFGIKAGTWADFGGVIKTGESSIEAASREAFEETNGLFGSVSVIHSMLQNSKKIETIYIDRNSQRARYDLYLWEISLPSWSLVHKDINCQCISCQFQYINQYAQDRVFREKTSICFIPLNELYQSIVCGFDYVQITPFDRIYIRDCFRTSIYQFPDFQAYLRNFIQTCRNQIFHPIPLRPTRVSPYTHVSPCTSPYSPPISPSLYRNNNYRSYSRKHKSYYNRSSVFKKKEIPA